MNFIKIISNLFTRTKNLIRPADCLQPIRYDDYNKMLKLNDLSEERYREINEKRSMHNEDNKIIKKSEDVIINNEDNQRELLFKEYGQEYAQVLRILGEGRVALSPFDGVARTGLIRGTMRRRACINQGDIVLIGLREFQPDKADIIHKYTSYEVIKLQEYSELPVYFTKMYILPKKK